MKKLISILGIVVLTTTAFTVGKNDVTPIPAAITQSAYLSGFSDGYCAGWKDVLGQFAMCPLTPMAPMPPIGQDNYKGGFIVGFKMGFYNAKNY